MAAVKASSSTSGFFQSVPVIHAQYTTSSDDQVSSSPNHNLSDDPVFSRVLSLYLPNPIPSDISRRLHDFARLVIQPSILQHAVDCDTNLPTIHPLNTFGEENKGNPLWTSEGWRALKVIQTQSGLPGWGYPQHIEQNFNRRIHEFATLHLWHGTCAMVTCPMSMADGAAVLLRQHLKASDGDQPGRGKVFQEAYRRLTSLEPEYAWTSGQWMTERTGGSDVRGTETVARRLTEAELQVASKSGRDVDAVGMPLGPWVIDGFKWFSSATDADMTVMLAQTENGLSAFYAPLRRCALYSSSVSPTTELNGVRIQRLKAKLGTKGVPTAELELKGLRAYLIGIEGKGIKEISSILNITRLHTAHSSVGFLARGLAVSRAYTKVRKVKGALLSDNPQHLTWMASETVKYRAHVHLTFLGVALLGASEQGHSTASFDTKSAILIPQKQSEIDLLLRLLTPVMKSQVSLNSVAGLRACMESLGGVGYCENNEDGGIMNIARLFRDCVVNTIWEGTTSVMAEDVLRVVKNPKLEGQGTHDVLDSVFGTWTRTVLQYIQGQGRFKHECRVVQKRYTTLRELVADANADELHWRGRQVVEHIEAIACACLLMFDACDGDEVAVEVARRWVSKIALLNDSLSKEAGFDWHREVDLDRKIFLGGPDSLQAKL